MTASRAEKTAEPRALVNLVDRINQHPPPGTRRLHTELVPVHQVTPDNDEPA